MLIHDSARPNFSIKFIKKIINNSRNNTVIPKIVIHDALKELVNKKTILNLSREKFFLTQTPQSFIFKEIHYLHSENKYNYKDDDLSLLQSLKKVKFIERKNIKITDRKDLNIFKNFMKKN